MRYYVVSCAFEEFLKPVCAVIVLGFGLALMPMQAAAGGKDPSTTKSTTSMSCSELDSALYETNRDIKRLKGKLSSDAYNLKVRKELREEIEDTIVELKAKLRSESDPDRKAKLKTKLAAEQRTLRIQKKFIAELTAEQRDTKRAITQANARADRFKKQMKKAGC